MGNGSSGTLYHYHVDVCCKSSVTLYLVEVLALHSLKSQLTELVLPNTPSTLNLEQQRICAVGFVQNHCNTDKADSSSVRYDEGTAYNMATQRLRDVLSRSPYFRYNLF